MTLRYIPGEDATMIETIVEGDGEVLLEKVVECLVDDDGDEEEILLTIGEDIVQDVSSVAADVVIKAIIDPDLFTDEEKAFVWNEVQKSIEDAFSVMDLSKEAFLWWSDMQTMG